MNAAPLIPRRVFFENPNRVFVQISPNGMFLSWLAPHEGVLNVWVADRENLASARPVTDDRGRGIRSYKWAYTNNHILYLKDNDGDENWRVYSVEHATGSVMDLSPFENTHALLLKESPEFPEEIVVGLNNRDPKWHDIYRVNLVRGERTLLLQHERFSQVLVDDDYRLRFATELTQDGGAKFHIRDGENWQRWASIPAEDLLTTEQLGFDKINQTLFMKDSRDRNTSACVAIDLETMGSQMLAEDPQADAGDVLCHPAERTVQAVSFNYDRKRWKIVDPSIEADFAYLNTLEDGDIQIASRSLDDHFWVVVYVVDDGPIRYYLYDRPARSGTFLFTARKKLESLPLAKMRPVVIKSRDGLDLVAYCSLPDGSDSNGDGIPDHPLPMVFTPHGGPWYRDNWGYHPWHQWLANRGYAVLSVNFRASTGFGKDFINAGDLEWGGKIIDDQEDAVLWAIGEGIADPDRVAVMGGSFGGYSTLAGLTFKPQLFACGVDLVGVSDLMTFLDSVPEYWKSAMNMFFSRIGDPRTEEGREHLRRHSPLTFVDRICRPLFIAHGANDPRVKQAESDQIVEVMQHKGISVAYALYPDEGHGFARPENNLSFYAMTEAFLAKCLGGRVEPVGNDFAGSSVRIIAGEEELPGVENVCVEG